MIFFNDRGGERKGREERRGEEEKKTQQKKQNTKKLSSKNGQVITKFRKYHFSICNWANIQEQFAENYKDLLKNILAILQIILCVSFLFNLSIRFH